MDPDVIPQLDGVSHRWVDVGGVRLHVAEAGTEHLGAGPSLVLVHGWPQHWWCWRHLIGPLATEHHVIAVDIRGFGWSDAPEPRGDAYDKRVMAGGLVSLVEHLGLDRPVLVGHDWGGWISLIVAGQAPAAISGVVAVAITAPWAPIKTHELWRFGYQLVAGGRWGVAAHQRFSQVFLKLVFRLGSGSAEGVGTARHLYLEQFRDPARAAAGRAMYRRFLRHELKDARRAGGFPRPPADLPLLFVPGRRDRVLTPKLVRRGAREVGAPVMVAPHSGHWVPEEEPQFLIERVRAFVEALPDTPGRAESHK